MCKENITIQNKLSLDKNFFLYFFNKKVEACLNKRMASIWGEDTPLLNSYFFFFQLTSIMGTVSIMDSQAEILWYNSLDGP